MGREQKAESRGQEVGLIERRPDRRWMRDLGAPAMDQQGSIAVIERPAFMSTVRDSRVLLLYSLGGLDGRRIELSVRVTGHRVALGRELLALEQGALRVHRFALP